MALSDRLTLGAATGKEFGGREFRARTGFSLPRRVLDVRVLATRDLAHLNIGGKECQTQAISAHSE